MSGRIITTNGIFGVIRGNASHRLARLGKTGNAWERLGKLRMPENDWE